MTDVEQEAEYWKEAIRSVADSSERLLAEAEDNPSASVSMQTAVVVGVCISALRKLADEGPPRNDD